MTGRPSTTDSSNKQCSNQLSLDAKTSKHNKSNDKAVQIGNSKELAVICQGSAQRVNQGFTYNLKLTINIDKTEKSKIIFHLESGGRSWYTIRSLSGKIFIARLFSVTLIVTTAPRQKLGWSYLFSADPYTYPTKNDSMGIMSGLQKPYFWN